MQLFMAILLPSEEPVSYVGIHPIYWHNHGQPTHGFRPATDDEIMEASRLIIDEQPDVSDRTAGGIP